MDERILVPMFLEFIGLGRERCEKMINYEECSTTRISIRETKLIWRVKNGWA